MDKTTTTQQPIEVFQFRAPDPWRELAWFALLGMELCWIFPWYVLFTYSHQAVSWLGALVFWAVILYGTSLLERLSGALMIRKNVRTWFLAGILLISILIGLKVLVYPNQPMTVGLIIESAGSSLSSSNPWFPPEFVVIAVTFLVAYRGISLVDGGSEPSAMLSGFRRGIVLLLLWSILASYSNRGIEGFWIYLAAFLLFGLIGMGASRLLMVGSAQGRPRAFSDRRRLTWLSAAILALVLLSTLVALGLSSRAGLQILLAFVALGGLALQALLVLITTLLLPILYVILQVLTALFSGHFGTVKLNLPDTSQELEQWVKVTQENSPASILWLKPFLLWGILAAMAVILLYVYQYQRRRKRSGDLSGMEILASDEDLLSLFLKNLRKNTQQVVNRFTGRFRTEDRILAAEQIRRIYGELLELCSQLNVPRPASVTPLEFLPRAVAILPDRSRELSTITDAYIKVRYGEVPESRQEVQAVEGAWSRVRQDGKNLVSRQRRKKGAP